jgi:hypothetical protein
MYTRIKRVNLSDARRRHFHRTTSGPLRRPYHLVTADGHEGKVRVGKVDPVRVDDALEQKTELDWAKVRNPQEGEVADNRPAPRAVAKNTAKGPKRSLRNIFLKLPT